MDLFLGKTTLKETLAVLGNLDDADSEAYGLENPAQLLTL
jgi:hypothetical protein